MLTSDVLGDRTVTLIAMVGNLANKVNNLLPFVRALGYNIPIDYRPCIAYFYEIFRYYFLQYFNFYTFIVGQQDSRNIGRSNGKTISDGNEN